MGVFSRRRDSDEAVIRRVLAGQRDEFGILVSRYLPAVQAVGRARIGNPVDAEDVAQETFLKAYLSLDTLREPGRFGAWLLSIARNMAHNLQRSESRRTEREIQSALPTQPPAPDDLEFQHVLQAQLAALEEPAREILMLHYYAGKSTKELAELLGSSRDAVKKRLQRARETLGERMLREVKPAAESPDEQRRREARIVAALVALEPSWTAALPAAGLWATLGIAAAFKAAITLAVIGCGIGWWSYSGHYDGRTGSLKAVAPTLQTPKPSAVASPTFPGASVPLAATPARPGVPTPSTTGVIEGRIYDAERRTGTPGVDMVIRGDGIKVVATSDTRGRFRAEDLAPGTYTVVRDSTPLEGYPDRDRDETQIVELSAGEVVRVDYPLSQGTIIAGRVVDEAGVPLEGVDVGALNTQESVWRSGSSADDGRFVVAGFKGPGRSFAVDALKAGYAMKPVGELTVPPGGLYGIELVMTPESTISGTVVDEAGSPLKDVGVEARAIECNSEYRMQCAFTGTDGAYALKGLYPARYGIIITAPGSKSFPPDAVEEVELGREEHIEDLVLVSKWSEGLTIAGRVLYSNGKPVSRAEVYVRGWWSVHVDTSPDGGYVLKGLKPGDYTVCVSTSAGGFDPEKKRLNVPAGSIGVDFVLDPHAEIGGTVLDMESNRPLQAFELTSDTGIKPEISHSAESRYRRVQDQEGHFTLEDQLPGDTTLYARAPGYAQQTVYVKTEPGKSIDGVKIALSRGVTIEGIARNWRGEPVPEAQVYLGPILGMYERSGAILATTGPKGEFTVNVQPGTTRLLSAYHPDYAPASVEVTPIEGKTVRTEIVLGRGGSVEGTLAMNGEPMSGRSVSVIVDNAVSGFVTTDAAGYFRAEHLKPGEVTLEVHVDRNIDTTYHTLRQSIAVRDGNVTSVELNVPSGTAGLEGTRDLGNRLGHVALRIPLVSGGEFSVLSAAEHDTYSFTELPAGSATLKVSVLDELADVAKEVQSYDVNLVEGQTIRQDVKVP